MILSCSNICKSFGENNILKQVSFHIEDHEKAAIVDVYKRQVAIVIAATASSLIRPYAREYMVVPSPHINSFAMTGADVSKN